MIRTIGIASGIVGFLNACCLFGVGIALLDPVIMAFSLVGVATGACSIFVATQ